MSSSNNSKSEVSSILRLTNCIKAETVSFIKLAYQRTVYFYCKPGPYTSPLCYCIFSKNNIINCSQLVFNLTTPQLHLTDSEKYLSTTFYLSSSSSQEKLRARQAVTDLPPLIIRPRLKFKKKLK